MAREYTRQDDERLLALIATFEGLGIEVFIDENERPSMLAELMAGSFAAMDRAFWKLVGGLS